MAGGSLYVNHDYWAWGYSDAVPAAGSGKGKPGRRRWYQIDDTVYWANEYELPQLLAQIVAEPEVTSKAIRKEPARRYKSPAASDGISLPLVEVPTLEGRLYRLEGMFSAAADAALLAALAAVRSELDEQEEEELMLLLA